MGAVLQHLLDGSWAPLSFFFMKLSDAEKKYSAFDRELLAAYSSLHYYRFLLEGKDFTIFTDHKSLTHALFRMSLPWSTCQQRQTFYRFFSSSYSSSCFSSLRLRFLCYPHPPTYLISTSPSFLRCSSPAPSSKKGSFLLPSPWLLFLMEPDLFSVIHLLFLSAL